MLLPSGYLNGRAAIVKSYYTQFIKTLDEEFGAGDVWNSWPK
jgi:hypothetical protein